MPFVPTKIHGDAPKGMHLALKTAHDEAISIPVGAYMMQIEDPLRPDKCETLILVKVTKKQWVFRCACNPHCQNVITMSRSAQGPHNR